MKKRRIIAICSSASFYKQVLEVEKELKKRGFAVIVPITAKRMKKKNNFDVNSHKSWFMNPKDYRIKAELMRGHFRKVAKSDAILVFNLEKNGVQGYVGTNVLMEMALAFHLGEKIYLWNPISEDHPSKEEIIAMGSVVINQDLQRIT